MQRPTRARSRRHAPGASATTGGSPAPRTTPARASRRSSSGRGSASKPRRTSRPSASSPAVGSSSSSSEGRCRPMPRQREPLEHPARELGGPVAAGVRPDRRGRAPRRPGRRGRRRALRKARGSREPSGPGRRACRGPRSRRSGGTSGAPAGRSRPATATRPELRSKDRGEDPQQRRLAGAVGTGDEHGLALGDREVDARERVTLPEPACEALADDRLRRAHRPAPRPGTPSRSPRSSGGTPCRRATGRPPRRSSSRTPGARRRPPAPASRAARGRG